MVGGPQKAIVELTRSDQSRRSSQMFSLITFPWPVPSANAPLIAISSRSVPQPQRPTPLVTADTTAQRRSLVAR
jgi:hypothetical protein